MLTFREYSTFYDLLYSDKPYEKEALWIGERIVRFAPSTRSILDIGCGTGIYTSFLHQQGFEVQGIDISEDMIEHARLRNPSIRFSQGDARSYLLQEPVDAITALFHVMSYQTSDEDVDSVLKMCAENLKPTGLLCFDVWHGPAVVSQKPEIRVKRIRNSDTEVERTAIPSHDEKKQMVEVRYEVIVTRSDGAHQCFTEYHHMRYFFVPEMEIFLNRAGFEIVEVSEILTGESPSPDTWGVCYFARKK